MSAHFVKATVRIGGRKAASFITGAWSEYSQARYHKHSPKMDRIIDTLIETVAAMQQVHIEYVSCDRDIVFADSEEKVL